MPRKRGKHLPVVILAPIIVVTAAGVVLLQTALFHVNPVKIGYRRFDYVDCVIYSKEDSAEDDHIELGKAMLKNESALGLSYKAKVQLILCKSQKEIDRYLPFVRRIDRRNAGGFAPWPNTIYITPKIREKYGNLEGVLVHELSHILLLQNYGIVRCTKLWRRYEWIPEGFAVFYANWPVYFKRERLQESLSSAGIDLTNGQLLGKRRPKEVSLPVRFMLYYYFIDFLLQESDESQLAGFLRSACANPDEVEFLFKESFGGSLSEYVKSFEASLSE